MPKKKNPNAKMAVVDSIRHSEYYGLQDSFDDLYRRSQEGQIFDNLMGLILSRENILLAYRNIKTSKGSHTPGTDKTTIKDISAMGTEAVVEKVRFIVAGSQHGYRPKPVRRKDIPKADGGTRPLGIPCMWDRLVQQCIKQVLEPICEARFSNNSYGFRPGRSAEHAIAETHRLMQRSKLSYVVEFDLKGFFDNVNHSKLIKQIWAMGIHDKKLIFVIKRILKAPIRMPNRETIIPEKGTSQGGIISPLLANIVLNELDHWIDSQWLKSPIIDKYENLPRNKSGRLIKSNAYGKMRKSKLKEMYIIRYADDFRIFCRNYKDAMKTKIAVTEWLSRRLKLEVSEEKTRITNLRHKYMDFLGFKLKLYDKGNGWKVKSHIYDKKFNLILKELIAQFSKLACAKNKYHEMSIARRYNSMVLGIQNYFGIATDIAKDLRIMKHRIDVVAKSRLHAKNSKKSKLGKTGRELTEFEAGKYGNSKAMRYIKASGEPIYPLGVDAPRPPISKNLTSCDYTEEGRRGRHDNLRMNTRLLINLMNSPTPQRSIEYNDNKLSLFSAQRGKCAVTKRVFNHTSEIHCHHKHPRSKGGGDEYSNLVLVMEDVHRLIHAKKEITVQSLLEKLGLTQNELDNLNRYRIMAGNEPIEVKAV